jgi:biotin transport system substrate-specific component
MENSSTVLIQRKNILRLTLTALFAALIAAGTFVAIPLPASPVPIVLQNLFILLAGLILGPALGSAAVGLYLIAGAIGVPIFAGGSGGFVKFMGPTGGFLLGYLLVALFAGLIAGRPSAGKNTPLWRLFIAAFVGIFASYILGVPWLKVVLDTTWPEAFVMAMLPFIIGDSIKAVVAALIAPRLRRLIAENLDS